MKTAILSLLVAAGVAQASVQGFDISGYQGTVNFAGAYSSGARFVMIKVCARSKWADYDIVLNSRLTLFVAKFTRQPRVPRTSTAASRAITLVPLLPGSSEEAITLPILTLARAPRRPISSWLMAEAGPTMASRCQECWTLNTIPPGRPATA